MKNADIQSVKHAHDKWVSIGVALIALGASCFLPILYGYAVIRTGHQVPKLIESSEENLTLAGICSVLAGLTIAYIGARLDHSHSPLEARSAADETEDQY